MGQHNFIASAHKGRKLSRRMIAPRARATPMVAFRLWRMRPQWQTAVPYRRRLGGVDGGVEPR